MLMNLFWDVATSNLVLALLGLVVVIAFLVAHVPLIGRLLPSVVPYMLAAGLVAIATAALLCFLIGFRVSDDRAEARRLAFELQWANSQLAQQKATSAEKAKLADQKAAEADELQAKVDDYAKTLAARPAEAGNCDALDDGDLSGLQSLRRRAGHHGRANPGRLRGIGSSGPAAGP